MKSDSKLHYTILYSDCETSIRVIDDYKNRDDCDLVEIGWRGDKNPITYALRRLHTSFRLNQIIPLPFRHIWYNFLYRKIKNPENEIVITYATLFYKYDVDVFLKAWKKRGIKTYIIFLDSMKSEIYIGQHICPHILKYIPPENIFSFDKSDCEEYGFNYLNESYYSNSNLEIIKEEPKIEYDAYILARTKPGRTEIINNLYEMFKKHDVKAKIDFVAIPKLDKDFYANRNLNSEIKVLTDYVKYEDVIKSSAKSNCIIEIGQGGVNAPTLRYFEAVTHNRKLLTNIKYTKNLNFYNEKYMKITDFKEENIDFDWIKKREKVNYGYKGEFSPSNILKMIEKLEKSK
ncbi:hypothetical protein J6W91_00345 [Candidatus Saccharibacteria bacterium]|nr:hypothetical protein [Candidatus Saccharibacteria bacterium]